MPSAQHLLESEQKKVTKLHSRVTSNTKYCNKMKNEPTAIIAAHIR